MHLPVSLSRPVFWLALLAGALASGVSIAWSAPLAAASDAVQSRVARAIAEKNAGLRLKALAEIGKNLSLDDIAETLALADSLGELRARAVLRETAVKRWSELAPAGAWVYVAKLPEGRGKLVLILLLQWQGLC